MSAFNENNIKIKKERRKKYNTITERVDARRISNRISKRKSRIKLRESFVYKPNFKKDYKEGIYLSIKKLKFTHQATLKFNKFTGIDYAVKACDFFRDRLIALNVCSNIIYTYEYGAGDKKIHIHLAIDLLEKFQNRYNSELVIANFLDRIWNNQRVRNGTVWIKEFASDTHKENYLTYIFKQVLPDSEKHFRQKQVDLYYIHRFTDVPILKELTQSNAPVLNIEKPETALVEQDFNPMILIKILITIVLSLL